MGVISLALLAAFDGNLVKPISLRLHVRTAGPAQFPPPVFLIIRAVNTIVQYNGLYKHVKCPAEECGVDGLIYHGMACGIEIAGLQRRGMAQCSPWN